MNHIWLRHFGQGAVPSAANFGLNGGLSHSHPELLDWLATEFVDRGWSMKPLHRMIVLGGLPRQSSSPEGPAAWTGGADPIAADPSNRLLWRMNSRRMEAEAIRDSVLLGAGLPDRDPRRAGDLRGRRGNAVPTESLFPPDPQTRGWRSSRPSTSPIPTPATGGRRASSRIRPALMNSGLALEGPGPGRTSFGVSGGADDEPGPQGVHRPPPSSRSCPGPPPNRRRGACFAFLEKNRTLIGEAGSRGFPPPPPRASSRVSIPLGGAGEPGPRPVQPQRLRHRSLNRPEHPIGGEPCLSRSTDRNAVRSGAIRPVRGRRLFLADVGMGDRRGWPSERSSSGTAWPGERSGRLAAALPSVAPRARA